MRAYIFDAYGTLFDVHSAVARHADAVGNGAERLSAVWRTKQLEYSWVHALMRDYVAFQTLTERALDFAFAAVPEADRAARAALLDAYLTLDSYAEVPGVLNAMRARGAATGILSNGSRVMLDAAVSSAGLTLDHVLSVDDVRTFKTDARTYRMVLDSVGCEANEVQFHSSNRWDIAGAAAFGFQTVWVNRTEQPDEYPDHPPGRVVGTLNEIL